LQVQVSQGRSGFNLPLTPAGENCTQTRTVDTLSLFQNERENRTIAAGEYVFREGDLGAEAFVILEGEVEVEVEGRLIETLGPGDIFGEMAIISSSPRSATVRAKSEVILAVLDERRFQFLVQQTPRFAIHMMRLMADRLRRASRVNVA